MSFSMVEQSIIESLDRSNGSFWTRGRSNKTTYCKQGVIPINFGNGTMGPTPKFSGPNGWVGLK
jgi:hypothetical protein